MLAERVLALHLPGPLVVLALPRGGVPIAVLVARALSAPLDLLLVRKIGLPWQPELALAAVVDGEPPELVIDEEVQRSADLEPGYIESEAVKEIREIARRRALYLRGRAPVALTGKTVIVVDDGVATGTTMRAALKALRRRQPAGLVLAVPVRRAKQLTRCDLMSTRSSVLPSPTRSMRSAPITVISTRSATKRCSPHWTSPSGRAQRHCE